MTFAKKLIELCAWLDLRKWVGDKTLAESWQTCENVDWMLWLAVRAGVDKRKMVLCAARFAETVLDKMTDERSRNAVVVALRYGNGEPVSQEELDKARSEAYDAYDAYDAAVIASEADTDAAYAAYYAGSAYITVAAKAAKAAGSTANMADILREVITLEEITKGLGL